MGVGAAAAKAAAAEGEARRRRAVALPSGSLVGHRNSLRPTPLPVAGAGGGGGDAGGVGGHTGMVGGGGGSTTAGKKPCPPSQKKKTSTTSRRPVTDRYCYALLLLCMLCCCCCALLLRSAAAHTPVAHAMHPATGRPRSPVRRRTGRSAARGGRAPPKRPTRSWGRIQNLFNLRYAYRVLLLPPLLAAWSLIQWHKKYT